MFLDILLVAIFVGNWEAGGPLAYVKNVKRGKLKFRR